MKWLEIIHIRAAQNRSENLVRDLTEMLSGLQDEIGDKNIALFQQADLPSDFSLHLIHPSDTGIPEKSNTGQLLSSAAREFGLVNHTVWVLERGNKK